jgi:hypothetical protein
MPDFRRYAAIMAVFATVLYVALIVAGFGILSLWLDRDVISDPNAGPIAGPVMIGVSVLIVFFSLLSIALRVPEEKQRVSPQAALLIAVGAYFFFAVAGGVILGAGRGDPFGFVVAFGGQLLSPFAAICGALAFIVVLLDMIVLASRIGDRGRPRWPWEKRDDEDRGER